MLRTIDRARSFYDRRRVAINSGIVILLGVLGLFAFHRLLSEVHPAELQSSISTLRPWQIGASLFFTVLSYLLLTLYDVLALRIIGRPLPWKTAALASFTSYTLSHNLGLGLVTGGSARFRIYSSSGLRAADIARIIASASFAFWAGVIIAAGAALALQPARISLGPIAIGPGVLQFAGCGVLAIAAGLLLALRGKTRELSIAGWQLPFPSARQAAAQIAVASLDLAAASAALCVLVPGVAASMFPQFFLGYALAIVIALVTHVPGGIGIFEAVVLAALPKLDRPSLLAALVAYRAIYYLLPLCGAVILLAIHERRAWRRPLGRAARVSRRMVSRVTPVLLSVLTFAGGSVLLVSGSLPAVPQRLHALRHVLPLPFVEASHFAASLAGTGLLLLAPGLFKRLDSAFILTRLLLIAGAAFSLAKGFDFEEAGILLLIAALLQAARSNFYRRTAFTADTFTAGWIAAVAMALGLSMWIGLISFRHIAYQDELWWQFAWKGDASRFLRASLGAAVAIMAAILMRFGKPALPPAVAAEISLPSTQALFESERADTMLAWTGDKRFLVSESGRAFLMYQVQGQSWIVMGDPVGPEQEWAELLWRLRELADAAQGRLMLYQASVQALPLAVDLGLQLVKYGEEARVDLSRFDLNGRDARSLRYSERRAVREGASFEIVPAADLPGIMPELQQVSDAWLKAKGRSELAFSVGRFDPHYLSRFDCAVVRHQGRIVAFANIWASSNRNELSVDLMRHGDDMPYGTMDLLFSSLMQWGRDQGYRWFILGIAPLSGIEAHRLSPVWARVSAAVYRHGGQFYGFEGLRAYKGKFSPQWEPRFIAGPGSLGLIRALVDLRTLVGGGKKSASAAARVPIS